MIGFLSKYGVAIHVALLVVWSSWARGGSSPAYFWALPWLSLLVWEMMLFLPPKASGQSPGRALSTLLSRIFTDPVFYFGVVLLSFLAIQCLNGPRTLQFDAIARRWDYTPAPLADLPFCVDKGDAVQPLIWFFAAATAVLAVKNATKDRSKYMIFRILSINGALLSILGFLQMFFSPDRLFWYREMEVYFFSTFGYPNHAGTFFMLISSVNMGLLARAVIHREKKREILLWASTLLLNAAAVYGSLCRAAIILETGLIVFAFAFALFRLRDRFSANFLVKTVVVAGLAVALSVFSVARFGQGLVKELSTIDSGAIAGIYDGDRGDLAGAALDIWKDNPWTGVGGWGFRRYVALYMPPAKWEMIQQHGKANVHNDILQFLCEHGCIGAGLIFAIAITLAVRLVLRISTAERAVDPDTGAKRSILDSLPPTVVTASAGIVATVIHSTIDLPFRSTAVLLAWFIVFAALPGIIRKQKEGA